MEQLDYQQEFQDITCEPTLPRTCSQCGDEDLVRRTSVLDRPARRSASFSLRRSPCPPRPSAAAVSQDQVYCSTTGFKQEVRCLVGPRINGSDQESYTTFQSCAESSSSFAGVVKFEVSASASPDVHALRARPRRCGGPASRMQLARSRAQRNSPRRLSHPRS
jgi:hypothetical protein